MRLEFGAPESDPAPVPHSASESGLPSEPGSEWDEINSQNTVVEEEKLQT